MWWPCPLHCNFGKIQMSLMALELDLFSRICAWCHKKVGGEDQNHRYITLHDPLPSTCQPLLSFCQLHWFLPCCLNRPGTLPPEDLCTRCWLHLNALFPHTYMAYILTSFWPLLCCHLVRTYLAPCWENMFYLVCLTSPLEFKRAGYSPSPLPNLSLVPRITPGT